jgi:hypothetical protein
MWQYGDIRVAHQVRFGAILFIAPSLGVITDLEDNGIALEFSLFTLMLK